MNTLAFPPFPATKFRSGIDWVEQEWYDTQRPFSDFDFVEQVFGVKKEHVNTTIRIFSVARQLGFQSLLKEELSGDNSLKREEDDRVRKIDLDFNKSKIYRFSFFACPVDQYPKQDDFLGYAVIKADYYDYYRDQPTPHIYVYESVLAPNHPEHICQSDKQLEYCKRNFLHCQRKYEIETILGVFSVTGAMYAQQNGRNFVCSHVALRSVLSLFCADDISYDEIDRLAGRPCYSREGLTPEQINIILKGKGVIARCISREQFSELGVSSYSPVLYGYVESGCPSLLAFFPRGGTVGHIVPVLGHTFDADSWVPEARNGYFAGSGGYFSSEGWLDSFIIHDDNFGPYKTLPRNYLMEEGDIFLWGLDTDAAALCFEKMEAATIGVCWDFIRKNGGRHRPDFTWYNRFLHCANEGKLILRSLFINREHYIRQIEENIEFEKFEKGHLDWLRLHLPDKLWMVELSCRELFSAARSKFGEVLLAVGDVDEKFNSSYIPLILRLPGVVHFYPADSTYKTALFYRTPLFFRNNMVSEAESLYPEYSDTEIAQTGQETGLLAR